MAANWWKYGLCVFGGLGVGYVVGVKVTKNRCEDDYEAKISDIREIYRSGNKAAKKAEAPKKEPVTEKPEIQTKTSLDIQQLSQRRDDAMKADKAYSKAFKSDEKPGTSKEDIPDDEKLPEFVKIVDEFPEDNQYPHEVLKYHSDGVLSRAVNGSRVDEEDIPTMLGNASVLKRLDDDDCNQLYIVNDQWGLNYTIIFDYTPWEKYEEEEPYRKDL